MIIVGGAPDDLGREPLLLPHKSIDSLILFNLLNTELHDSLIIFSVMKAPSEPSLLNPVMISYSMRAVQRITPFTGIVLSSLGKLFNIIKKEGH